MPLAAGTRLGVFEILAPLGKGGMGAELVRGLLRESRDASSEDTSSPPTPPFITSETSSSSVRRARVMKLWDEDGFVGAPVEWKRLVLAREMAGCACFDLRDAVDEVSILPRRF